MKVEVPIDVHCDNCGADFTVGPLLDQNSLIPENCAHIKPTKHLAIFNITSGQIEAYLNEKIQAINPEASIYLEPMYCEPKLQKWEAHRGYAVLPCAFNADSVVAVKDNGIPRSIAKRMRAPKLIESVARQIVKPYELNMKDYNKDYKDAEYRLRVFGITPSFAKAVYEMIHPVSRDTDDGKPWIAMALKPYPIIRDMVSDAATKQPPGTVKIVDVMKTDEEDGGLIHVTFTISVELGEPERQQKNPYVRAMLAGFSKSANRK